MAKVNVRFPRSMQELIRWYERYISPLSLVAGFLADTLYLTRRVDLWQTNALLGGYLTIAALGITLINAVEMGKIRWKWVVTISPLIPVVVQFAFGGLFSGYLSLYGRSAGFAASWIFVLIVAGFLIGNERFTRLYVRFSFQMSLYFAVAFLFFIFFLPVLFHAIGPAMFVFSGIASLALIALIMRIQRLIVPELVKKERTRVARRIAVIFLIINGLYFWNLIPPLPLALKEAGVYHNVVKIGTDYHLTVEPQPWYVKLLSYSTVFHTKAGATAYAYSAVFAPSGLSTTIVHEWQRYDDTEKQWVTVSTQRFPINGGRDGGYRGWSEKSDPAPGKWRVNVKTQYGQLVGVMRFTVDDGPYAKPLEEAVH
jgi:hypothetical protein